MELGEWQKAFVQALDSGGALPGLVAGSIPPAVSAAVYRNTIAGNAADALRDVYTAVSRLLGEQCFGQVAHLYAARTPSTDPDLAHYGATFPAFLKGLPTLSALAYVADMARLEWQCHLAYIAPETTEGDARDVIGGRLRAHPAACFFASPYPLKAIWDLCVGDDADATVALDSGACHLLVHRMDGEVVLVPLAPPVFAFGQALCAGESLAQALTAVDAVYHEACYALLRWGVFRQGA